MKNINLKKIILTIYIYSTDSNKSSLSKALSYIKLCGPLLFLDYTRIFTPLPFCFWNTPYKSQFLLFNCVNVNDFLQYASETCQVFKA